MIVYVLSVENDHEMPMHEVLGVFENRLLAYDFVSKREQSTVDRWIQEHTKRWRYWSGHDQYFITEWEVQDS